MEKNKTPYGILLPVKRKYTKLIIDGIKIAEARKKIPNIELPCPVYIYESFGTQRYVSEVLWGDKYPDWFGYEIFIEPTPYNHKRLITEGRGTIVARFTLESIKKIQTMDPTNFPCITADYQVDINLLNDLQLSYRDLLEYGNKKTVYAWEIKNLQLINEVNLTDISIKQAPQTFIYLTKEQVDEIERLNETPF